MSQDPVLAGLYPPGPASAPPDLTTPTSAYKQLAWIAMLGLAGFVLLYFALSGWFAWTAFRLLRGMTTGNASLESILVGVGAAFLAVFMLKALVFVKHGWNVEDIEITRAQQPRLFAFIDRLADEAKAPRAHRVFLSPRVNAAVFYDLSLLNLIVPSRKNLEIGLGLVNVATLGELKAVLAHEFGHFAQRSMAVGRWVYVAQQIAAQIIGKRDILDRLLQQLSRLDLRVAWIGWLLSLTVWSIRSLMETVFRGVVIAERGLSRQMEFQADLVSASLTGSDALINALHRLGAADDAWDRALGFAGEEVAAGRKVRDLYALQSRIVARMREVLGQPEWGIAPPLPEVGRDAHRVFKTQLAQPPRMWSTHPPNAEREENVKRRYIEAALDERSAWELLDGAQELREQISAHVLRKAEGELVPLDDSLARLDAQWRRESLDRAYRGAYLGRSVTRHAAELAALTAERVPAERVVAELGALYPEALAAQIERWTELREEKAALEALRDGAAAAPGGVIRHRGRQLQRDSLPRAIEEVTRELNEVEKAVRSHDARCRAAHLAAAERLGSGWPDRLRALLQWLHYAEHTQADLADAQGALANAYSVAVADGRVSGAERKRLLAGAADLHAVLSRIHAQVAQLPPSAALLARLGKPSWAEAFGKFELPPPTEDRLGDWLNVVDSWVAEPLSAFGELRAAALDELLAAEKTVALAVASGVPPGDAPAAGTIPFAYPTWLAGSERPRVKLSWWDRFQTADGALPTALRLATALAIVGAVVGFSARVGEASVSIVNGLARDIVVDLGGTQVEVAAKSHALASIPEEGRVAVVARTSDGEEIESFAEDVAGANVHYVYDVAGAAPLYLWTAVYGGTSTPPIRKLGALRWSRTGADFVFEEPPHQLKTDGPETRTVLASVANLYPANQLEFVPDERERGRLALAHARWDATTAAATEEWLWLARNEAEYLEMLALRLQAAPSDPLLLRAEQEAGDAAHRSRVCERQRSASAAAPDDASLRYAAIRCMPDDAEQDAAFLAARDAFPEHGWLALSAGYVLAQRREWAAAEDAFVRARTLEPSLRQRTADEIARLRRLRTDGAPRVDDLLEDSAHLRSLVAIETGKDADEMDLEAFHWLARGDVARAAEAAILSGLEGRRLLVLCAGSDGADDTLRANPAVLSVAPDDDLAVLLVSWALAARAQRDLAEHEEAIRAVLEEEAGSVLALLDALRRGADPSSAVQALARTTPQMRGIALTGALVLLGPEAPSEWRTEVKRSLWVGERPYFE